MNNDKAVFTKTNTLLIDKERSNNEICDGDHISDCCIVPVAGVQDSYGLLVLCIWIFLSSTN